MGETTLLKREKCDYVYGPTYMKMYMYVFGTLSCAGYILGRGKGMGYVRLALVGWDGLSWCSS